MAAGAQRERERHQRAEGFCFAASLARLARLVARLARCSEMLCGKMPEKEANSPFFSGW